MVLCFWHFWVSHKSLSHPISTDLNLTLWVWLKMNPIQDKVLEAATCTHANYHHFEASSLISSHHYHWSIDLALLMVTNCPLGMYFLNFLIQSRQCTNFQYISCYLGIQNINRSVFLQTKSNSSIFCLGKSYQSFKIVWSPDEIAILRIVAYCLTVISLHIAALNGSHFRPFSSLLPSSPPPSSSLKPVNMQYLRLQCHPSLQQHHRHHHNLAISIVTVNIINTVLIVLVKSITVKIVKSQPSPTASL